jgi:hypothetical protein
MSIAYNILTITFGLYKPIVYYKHPVQRPAKICPTHWQASSAFRVSTGGGSDQERSGEDQEETNFVV